MTTPKDMERFTNNEVVKMYEKLNQDLTKEIIRKIKKNGDISSFTRSQMRTLKQLGGKEIFKTALNKVNGLSKKQKKEISKLFDDIGNTSIKGYSNTYKIKGIDYELSPQMEQILKYAKIESNKTLRNLTGSIAYKTKRIYINALDNLYKEVITGAYDYNTALKRTIKELADKGITLETSNGRNEQLGVAIKRGLYTGIQRTATSLAREVGDLIGANCVVIGHSDRCRPSHHVIDAVTMSIEKFKEYEYLTEEYNCNHIVNYDWQEEFEGTRAKVEAHDDRLSYSKTVKNYKKYQKANYYERQIRSKKNDIASGNTDKKAKTRLKLAQKKYREYCKKNNLDIDYTRTWEVGYNK